MSDKTDQSVFPLDSRVKKRRGILMRWWLAVIVVAIVIAAAIAYVLWPKPSSRSNAPTRQDRLNTIQSFKDAANQNPRDSIAWANMYGNAAMYAAENGLCSDAKKIMDEIAAANVPNSADLIKAYNDAIKKSC